MEKNSAKLLVVLMFFFCFCGVFAQSYLTKIDLEISGFDGINSLNNSDGNSVRISIFNTSGIIVSRNAVAGIYLNNMTLTMSGNKFYLNYASNYTYNLSTIYGDFLYNFTTPNAPTEEFNFLGTAQASYVKSGYSFYNNSQTLWTGTMPTQTLSSSSTTLSAGYYAATTLSSVDADLSSSNIKSGANIFGIAGSSNVVDTTTGTVNSNAQIRSGYIAWSDGTSYTGSIADCSAGGTSCYANSGKWYSSACATSTTSTTTACYIDSARYITPTACSEADNTGQCYITQATKSALDTDLIAGNIRKGAILFGITGTWGPGIGDEYGGGKIIYINPSTGYILIAATADEYAGTYRWGTDSIIVGPNGRGTSIGTGKTNTAAIINIYGTDLTSAKLCNDSTRGGYSDWFLPSTGELTTLSNYRIEFSIDGKTYWSSTEDLEGQPENYAYKITLGSTPFQARGYKTHLNYVRCMREEYI